jgi:alpha-L-fucosidase
MGNWIDVNGEAIYSTRAIAPFKTDNICLTQQKDSKAVYALYLEEEDGSGLPSSFVIRGIQAAKKAKLSILGTSEDLKWKNTKEGLKIEIPEKIRKNLPCDLAWAVKISAVN